VEYNSSPGAQVSKLILRLHESCANKKGESKKEKEKRNSSFFNGEFCWSKIIKTDLF